MVGELEFWMVGEMGVMSEKRRDAIEVVVMVASMAGNWVALMA